MASELERYLNTNDGMTQIATMQDDQTVSCVGASWFKYNGVTCDTIYISGNSWIGFGVSNEHMKIDRRDAKCHYLYRQELIYKGWQCIKFRWEGYSYYNQTSDTYKLIWELFLFETGDLFVNVIKNSNMGTNSFDTLGGSGTFNPITGAMISGYCGDAENGKVFALVNEMYQHTPSVIMKYIIEIESEYYVVDNGELVKLNEQSLSYDVFQQYGMDKMPTGTVLKNVPLFKIHRWQDKEESVISTMQAEIKALPKPQIIVQNYDVDFSHESIANIKNVKVNATIPDGSLVKFVVSMDSGSTWKSFDRARWNDICIDNLDDFYTYGMDKITIEAITNEQWISFVEEQGTRKYRFAIYVDANTIGKVSLTDIVVNYNNK